jgi:hypothetical protein
MSLKSSNSLPLRGMCQILQNLFRQAYTRTHVPLPPLPTEARLPSMPPPSPHSPCSCPAADGHASIIRTCSCLLFILHFMLGIVRLKSVCMRLHFLYSSRVKTKIRLQEIYTRHTLLPVDCVLNPWDFGSMGISKFLLHFCDNSRCTAHALPGTAGCCPESSASCRDTRDTPNHRLRCC